MRLEIKMPDVAATESEVQIVRWIVQPGQRAVRGKPLLEVETDKGTVEIESVASGVLCAVRAQAAESVLVGDVIAVLELEGESVAADSACLPWSCERRVAGGKEASCEK